MDLLKDLAKNVVDYDRHNADIEREIARQGSNWTAGQGNAYAHARMSAEIAHNLGETVSTVYGDMREVETTRKFYKGDGEDYRTDTYRDLWNNAVGRKIAEYIKDNGLSPKDIDRLVKSAMENGDLITSIRKSSPDPRLPNVEDLKTSGFPFEFNGSTEAFNGFPDDFLGNPKFSGAIRQTDTPPHVNNNGQPSRVSQFTNPHNSPNPADRPARTNDGVKNDTYNGQTSGPNRGLGDGGNKAAGTSSKAPSNKSDGSYFSDFGGGGGSAGQQARTGNDPSGPSRSVPSRSGGSEAGQSARRGNDPTGPSRSEPSRSDKTDKGQSPKNDTHNGQKSGPNRGLGDGGKSGSNKSDSGKSGSNKSDSGKSGSSKSDGGESARRGNDPAGPNRSKPIILDLDGDGIEITELSRSNVFMDSGGDGLLHRTAWAGAGDGVLFFDANGDNKIGEKREYVFTEWDPTATGDFAALRAAFDSNGDGKLTAADAGFSKFKVLVTNADGSQTARTLTELGIREIGLLGDATHITLPDGSVITGQASFTRTNGTTGTVADVILVADAEGRRVVQREQTNAQGTRTVTSTAYEADGGIAYVITSVISRDGLRIVNFNDNDGDGVADLMQTIDTVIAADGSRRETLINYEGNSPATAAVMDRTVTTTSTDNRTLTIERDTTGGGWFDQREVQIKAPDGSQINTIYGLARDGSIISSSVEMVTAGGLVRIENLDPNGDGLLDTRTTDAFAQQGTERVNTVTTGNRDGSLRSRTEERVSADGRTKTISTDANGDGVSETRKATVITLDAAGASSSTLSLLNADGSLRSKTVQTQSADTLSKTIKADVDGDGDYDTTTQQVTATAANGTRTETLTVRNVDGSVRDMTKTTLAADKVTRDSWVDLNEDGTFQATDITATVRVDILTQARTAQFWERNYDGSIKASTTAVTSANGLSTTARVDADGDGDIDSVIADVTVKNADGSATRTVTVQNADGSQRSKSVTTVSADGLTERTEADTQGSTAVDGVTVTQLVKNADGSLTRTASLLAGNGTTLLSKTVTTESADRLTKAVVTDTNGDGFKDLDIQMVVSASGAATVTTQSFRPDGGLTSRTVINSDRSGLLKSSQSDANGDGTVETIISDTTTLNADGSRTQTVDINNGNGSDRSLSVTWVSDDGLQKTTQLDLTGDNAFDRRGSDTTSFGVDGSTVRTVTSSAGNGRLLGSATTTTRDDGLVVTRIGDVDGDGTADSRVTASVTLNNDGSTVTETKAEEQRAGSYGYTQRERTVTTVSDDQRIQKREEDVNGDNVFDRVTTRIIADTGVTTATVTDRDTTGGLQSRSETVTSANQLSVMEREDDDGDGVYEQQTLSQTVLNGNGSTLLAVTEMSSSGAAYRRQSTLTSDDGTTVTYDLDRDGNGTNDLQRVRFTSLDANGSVTSSMSEASGSGRVYHTETSFVSADKRTSSLTVDDNGDGRADWRKAAALAADGVTTVVREYFSRTGVLEGRVTETVSLDGLVKTGTRDWDADGRAELIIRDETGLAADGSAARDVSYRNGNGALMARDTLWTGDDGLTRIRSLDNNGDGASDSVSRSTTVYETGGDVVTAVELRNAANALAGTSATRVSGNGLNSSFEVSVDGVGGPDRTVTSQTAADGESTTVNKFFKTTGALSASETVYTRADGRYENRSIDDDGNGAADHVIATTTDVSRNVTEVRTDYNAAGNVTARVTLVTAANAMSQNMVIDADGNGTVDILRSSATSFLGQTGASAELFTEVIGGRTSFNSLKLTAGNSLSSTVYVDTDGNGRVDYLSQSLTTYGDDGSVTDTQTQTYADGSRKSSQFRTESADSRTVTAEHDRNGDGATDVREVQSRDAEGNTTVTSTIFNVDRAVQSTSETWDSADGLKTRVVRTGQIAGAEPGTPAYRVNRENITRSPLKNGDYEWDNGITATENIGQTQIRSIHKVDAAGIETWTYSTALKTREWREHDAQIWQEREVQVWRERDVQIWQERQEWVEKKNKVTEWRWVEVRDYHGRGEYSSYWAWKKVKVTYTWWEAITVGEWVTTRVGEWITTKAGGWTTVKVGEWHDRDFSSSKTAVLDAATKSKIFAEAERIYDTVLDRTMYSEEREALVTKIVNGALDAAGLAQMLIASAEFTTRFGLDGNAAYVSRLYLNALGRAPTMGEFFNAINALTPTAGLSEDQKKAFTGNARSILAVSIANSGEHHVIGNELLPTNNIDLALSIPKTEVLLDRSEVRAMVERLFDTLVNRQPSESELATYMPRLMDESPGATRPRLDSVADILLRGAAELKDLSVDALVERVLQNAFDRSPSTSEIALWRDMINGNKLTKADFVAALSESPEHRGFAWGDLHGREGNDVLLGTGGANVLYGEAGQDALHGLAGDDRLFGGADNDDVNGDAGDDRLEGGTGDDRLDGETGNDIMLGGAGNDSYVVDAAGDVVSENPNEGVDTVSTSLSYVLGVNVENLVLTGFAAVNGTGNALDNMITGNSANNVLDGGSGSDTLRGGSGDDKYIVGAAGDIVIEKLNEGIDTIKSSVSYVLPDNVENLDLTGETAITGTGNALNNSLTGNTAANVLDGGAGNDSMVGGQGDDTYIVDSAGDVVIEKFNEGKDTVKASINYVLEANVENLVLTGTAAINGTGNTSANSLVGNLANNELNGGAGSDTMAGGLGDDTYVVDAAGDIIIENANEGADTVNSSVSFALSDSVEKLVLTGMAAINGTGNSINNMLIGNSAANILYGGTGNDSLDGGAGNDIMAGGLGDDSYVVDTAGDIITEGLNEGSDTVNASISYVLGANVENLMLTGSAAVNGTGNALENTISGNSASNVLDGGSGADTLRGGSGDDTYIVGAAGDVVIEKLNDGTDTIKSSVSYILRDNVENLDLTGEAAIAGTGNALNNILTGNAAANVLEGGAGNDSMAGGQGDDTYVVDAVGDVVTEKFNEGKDTVRASINYVLGATVENLVLTGQALIGTGNALANNITGNLANNELNGGAGSDTMAGGLGDDTYVVDAAGDIVIENANEGADTVNSSVSFALSDNLETLILTGIAAINGTGNSMNNVLIGNSAANILNAGTGDDRLDGGAGNDIMAGGLGDDSYVVDTAGDFIMEGLNEGSDTVYASISYVLGANVENLVLTGAAAVNGTGNALSNYMTGSEAANRLDGGAGDDWLDGDRGNDTMVGGTGNDTYAVDAAGDVVTERLNEGTDTVNATTSYVLGANVENLVLTGTAAINGTGNALNNKITGNSGNNILQGGAGDDMLDGGAGIDTLVLTGRRGDYSFNELDTTAIRIVDSVLTRDGTDVVSNIENVRFSDGTFTIDELTPRPLIKIVGSPSSDQLTGTSQRDAIYGLSGNDRVTGGGGADVILGGDGDDVYVWNHGDGDDVIYEAAKASGNSLSLAGVSLSKLTCKWSGSGMMTLYIAPSEAGRSDGGSIKVNPSTLTSVLLADATWQGADLRTKLLAASITNGRDVIYDFDGNDALAGGKGDDLLMGGAGHDSFIWNRGDGNDIIDESYSPPYRSSNNSIDSLVLKNISSQQVKFRVANVDTYSQNLIIDVLPSTPGGADGASLTVRNFDGTRIESFVFSDRVMTSADIGAILLRSTLTPGTPGNDVVTGTNVDDLIVGGRGDDVLDGRSGNDTYEWSRGDGNDVIDDTGNSLGHGDRIVLRGVTASQVTVERMGQYATLRILPSTPGGHDGGSVKLHLASHFSNFMSIQIEGKTWDWTDLAALAEASSANEFIFAGSRLDIGGKGNDYLQGSYGNDTFTWRRGDGDDILNEDGFRSDDILVLRGVQRSQLSAVRYSDGVKLVIAPSTASAGDGGSIMVLPSRYEDFALETIILDSSTLGPSEIKALIATALISSERGLTEALSTPGNDWLMGTASSDVMYGESGDDVLILRDGTDYVTWSRGAGNDLIIDSNDPPGLSNWAYSEDLLILGDVTPDQVSVRISGNLQEHTVLLIHSSAPGLLDGGTIELWYNATRKIMFSNGVTWFNSDLSARALADSSTSGNDRIIASEGRANFANVSYGDIITGGPGDDYIDGGWGDDTYVWIRGDGNDVIRDSGYLFWDSPGDTLQLKNVSVNQVNFQRLDPAGGDLSVIVAPSAAGQNDGARLTIGSVALGYGVENIVLKDATLKVADIAASFLASSSTAGNDWIAGFNGNDTLSGGEGHDTLDGRNGNDVLIGGAGHDLLTGGYGDDRFVFTGDFGFDVITDFYAGERAGDVLQLSLGRTYDSFAEVIAVASQVNADTVLDFGGLDCITLQNVSLASLNADDFLFAA